MSILKKFWLSFLGSMAAIWFTFLLLLVLIVAGVVASVSSLGTGMKSMAAVEVTKGSVIYLDLTGPVNERKVTPSISEALQGGFDEGINLSETVDAIYRAAHDQRICGIYIEGNGVSGGVASLQDIREALDYFKSQPDKWIVAYSDTYAQADYYISSVANEIWLNPIGAVDLHGLSGTTLFYTGLLDKLGIKMQILRVGTFKSAVEPYFLKEMSPASRMQQESYMEALWSSMRKNIAESLDVDPEKVDKWANDFTFTMSADSIKALGLVTELGYRHEAESQVAKLAKKDKFDDVNRVTVSEYYATIDSDDYSYLPDVKTPKNSDKTIAVLYAVGEIVDEGKDGIVGDDMVEEIMKLADDSDDLAGLILRVNSPGGSAFASEQIWEALQQFKTKTDLPFYVSMGDVAASGGYYISCGADVIYAQPTTITGSIGIFGMIPEIKGLLNNHLGITTSTVMTNKNGNFPSLLEPMTPEQHAKMQAYIERGYDLFTRRCAQGRHTTQDSIKAIAEGRVWAGTQALHNGLVDRMGTLRTAIYGMASDLGLDAYHVKAYPETTSKWWEALLSMDELEMDADLTQLDYFKHLKEIQKAPTVHCRMETVIIK
ncbi:MAG: signal peptide peptidase SppA [Bacteroides sp.]|nr:signal peptide peptidase SppA [Bacteroides sp.]MCM1378613.1 signal peptide peptidase SppA [Bacteroides sp.]MCM1444914.1 signal peptide peptidase SppA [Prevotella sp.]